MKYNLYILPPNAKECGNVDVRLSDDGWAECYHVIGDIIVARLVKARVTSIEPSCMTISGMEPTGKSDRQGNQTFIERQWLLKNAEAI